jgi:hypothetical protein
MTDTTTNATRRAVIAGLAGSVAFAGTIGAAISGAEAATPGEPTPEGNRLYDEAFGHGFKEGGEIALLHTAQAWVNRWKAAGGDFSIMWPVEGGKGVLMFGQCEPHVWQPTDEAGGALAPHLCLTEPEHQAGAIKALEALLHLVPGLREAVRDVVGIEAINAPAREA